MDLIVFCISLLALSVTFASSQECTFKRNSKVLVIDCSRSLQTFFTIPDKSLYRDQKFESISADYQFNKLQTITKFTFAQLRSLNLANNKINSIEDGAFSKVGLYELDLSFNKIQAISGKQLMGLKELRTLSLYNNNISQIDPDVFVSLVLLEYLNLGHNFIKGQLDPALFLPLAALTTLSLQENALESVHQSSFLSQKYLENLSLAENLIEGIHSTCFENLWNLKNLDLSHNKLIDLDDTIFKSQLELEFLDLSWNSLEYFGKNLELSPSLKVLKIGHNSLKDVEISGKVKNLKEIHVENNALESLKFLIAYDALEVVNASSNSLSDIDERLYRFLHTLDLSNNSFTTIPSLITSNKLPSLIHLHMDMNPISSLKFPMSEENFKSLKLVSLSRMPLLKEVSRDSFDALRRSGNRQRRSDDFMEYDDETDATINENPTLKEEEETTIVPDEIKGFPNSNGLLVTEATEETGEETVTVGEQESGFVAHTDADSQVNTQEEENDDLEENLPLMKTAKLQAAPDDQEVDGKVVDDCSAGGITLDISHNENLVKIEDDALLNIDICKLDLSNNALTSVPKNMATWDDLPSVDLQGNPWDCSCSLQWVLDTIVAKLYPSQEKQHLLYELRCASPMELRGLRFVHFYNWTEAAFCAKHGQMRKAPTSDDNATGVTLQLGGSTGMFVGVGVAIGMVALLVGVAAWLHRSNTLKKRARNRRV